MHITTNGVKNYSFQSSRIYIKHTISIIAISYIEKSYMIFLFQFIIAHRTSHRNPAFILLCENHQPIKQEHISVC